jgi:hypothetical protein
MKRFVVALVLASPAACRPPASDGYVQRIALDDTAAGPQVLMTSPDTKGAIWAESGGAERIVFGQPGSAPLLALACAGEGAGRAVVVTRFAATDATAQGMMALIGNGHVERLKIDSRKATGGWLWEGRYRPVDTRLDALTGGRGLELTIPGAGTLKLPPSPRTGELVQRCRRLSAPEAEINEAGPPANPPG